MTAAQQQGITCLAALQRCPVLYSVTDDYAVVMARPFEDNQTLEVCANLPGGIHLKNYFNEGQLTKIKAEWNGEGGWDKFFMEMTNLFNRSLVKMGDKEVILTPESGDHRIKLKLKSTSDDTQKSIIQLLDNYHHTVVNLRDIEKSTMERMHEEKTLKLQREALEAEDAALRQTIEQSKKQEESTKKRYKELSKELKILEQQKKDRGEIEEEEEDEDSMLCHTHLPLGKKECKDYNKDVFKLVKSRYLCENDAMCADNLPFNKVIHPFSKSEFTKYIGNLNDEQQKKVCEILDKIENWDYNVFEAQSTMAGDDIESLSFQPHGGSLMLTAYALFFKYSLLQKFQMDEKIFLNWLSCVEAGYKGNPYHNSMHAADVLHITHFVLTKGGMAKQCNLNETDMFSAFCAAIIHDYAHPGINNSFHMKAATYLAYLYNDRSILENMHVSTVFELMKLPRFNILSNFTPDQRQDIRETMVEMVLATDMGLHGKFVSQFKKRVQENRDLVKKEDQRLAMSMAIKMADVSNCGRPTDIYLRWANKISDEFYLQGDRERNLGLPCSPFMDRLQPAMGKGQISFMNYVIIPLFDCISELVPDMRFAIDFCEQNKAYWVANDDS